MIKYLTRDEGHVGGEDDEMDGAELLGEVLHLPQVAVAARQQRAVREARRVRLF